jgi:hypothetical protein
MSAHVIMVLTMCRTAERASDPYDIRAASVGTSRSGRKGPGQRSVSDVDREAVAVDERSRRAVYAWWNVTMCTSLPSGSTRV